MAPCALQGSCCISHAGGDEQSPRRCPCSAVGTTAHTVPRAHPEKNTLTRGEGSGSAFPISQLLQSHTTHLMAS